MTDLLPCPFCGGEARVWKYSHPSRGEYWHAVCEEPYCCIVGCEDTEAEAIAAWNERAERTCRNLSGDFAVFRCSECGYFERDCACANYCPHCGAKVIA